MLSDRESIASLVQPKCQNSDPLNAGGCAAHGWALSRLLEQHRQKVTHLTAQDKAKSCCIFTERHLARAINFGCLGARSTPANL